MDAYSFVEADQSQASPTGNTPVYKLGIVSLPNTIPVIFQLSDSLH